MVYFELPTKKELDSIDSKERMNIFRQYFAASRYDRLIIQKCLLSTAYNKSRLSEVKEMERVHDDNYYDKVKTIKEYGFIDEFIVAVKEEERAIQKIIEAYDKRMRMSSL
jgi:type IV secretory pathway VirB4 component